MTGTSGGRKRWSTGRLLALLFGGLLLVAVVIEVLGRVVGPAPASPAAAAREEPESEPIRPEASRQGDTIVIKMGDLMTTRITTDGGAQAVDLDALEACLRTGYEREFDDPAEGAPGRLGPIARIADRGRVHEAASRIQHACMQEHLNLPAIPSVPSRPEGD